MKYLALALCAATSVLLADCHNQGTTADSVSPMHVDVTASSTSPYVGEPVTFTVTAHNEQRSVESVAVDYTNDGTVDETQTCDARAVTLTFTHTYASPGTNDVRVEATDARGTTVSQSTEVTVTTPPKLSPITLTVSGSSPQDGRCYALGPPITCPDCAVLVGTSTATPVSVSLGQQYRGTQISITQEFNQWPIVFNDVLYQCTFNLNLIAGEPGHQGSIGIGSCSTSSLTRPATLNCSITVAGKVP